MHKIILYIITGFLHDSKKCNNVLKIFIVLNWNPCMNWKNGTSSGEISNYRRHHQNIFWVTSLWRFLNDDYVTFLKKGHCDITKTFFKKASQKHFFCDLTVTFFKWWLCEVFKKRSLWHHKNVFLKIITKTFFLWPHCDVFLMMIIWGF